MNENRIKTLCKVLKKEKSLKKEGSEKRKRDPLTGDRE